jgi:hypothetical protein
MAIPEMTYTMARGEAPARGDDMSGRADRTYVAATRARPVTPTSATPAKSLPTAKMPKLATPKRSKADSLRLVHRLKQGLVVGAIGGFIGLSGLVGTHLAVASGTATTSAGTSSGTTTSSSSTSTSSGGYFGQSGGSNVGSSGSSSSGSTSTSSGAVSGTSVS